MKWNLISIEVLIGYFVVLLCYIVGIYPAIRDQVALVTGADPLTTFMLSLIAPVFLIALIIGIVSYGLGRQPAGSWGGE
jgi:hypothetical protein